MEKINRYSTSAKGELMSVADQLRHEGLEQKENIAIKNMIHKNLDTKFICDVLEVSQEKVESIRRTMNQQS